MFIGQHPSPLRMFICTFPYSWNFHTKNTHKGWFFKRVRKAGCRTKRGKHVNCSFLKSSWMQNYHYNYNYIQGKKGHLKTDWYGILLPSICRSFQKYCCLCRCQNTILVAETGQLMVILSLNAPFGKKVAKMAG